MNTIDQIKIKEEFTTTDGTKFTDWNEATEHQKEVNFKSYYKNVGKIGLKNEATSDDTIAWLKAHRKAIAELLKSRACDI